MFSGVVSIREIRVAGISRKEVDAAVSAGQLRRVARGWYASPTAGAMVVAAVRAGGRLGCLSGCQEHGLWTPRQSHPHILIPRGAPGGPHFHRAPSALPGSAVYPLEDCLRQAVRHHDPETALTVLESAVNLKKVTPSQARRILEEAAGNKRRLLNHLDLGAGSGSETRVRFFLQRHRFPVRSQVFLPQVGYVDLLVGRSLVVECDSRAHHSDPENDRRRDMAARLSGYTIIRLSYEQIHVTWEQTQEFLLQVLRSRRHLRPPRPLS